MSKSSGILEIIGDPTPAPPPRTDPLAVLATIAHCYDATESEDDARVVAYRIMSMADREPRALHAWFHGNTTDGGESPIAPAPDPYDRVKAQTKVKRTRKGLSIREVVVHGRAYVQGATDHRDYYWHGPTFTGHASMSADRASRALQSVPRAVGGHDAIGIYRMTQALYGTSIPKLLGADSLTFHEWHSNIGTARSTRTGTPRKVTIPSRYRLPSVSARKGETSTVEFADGQSVARLLSPSVVDGHAWRGHKLYVRPITVREQRAANAKPAEPTIDIPETVDVALFVAALADTADVGTRHPFTFGTRKATLVVGQSTDGRRRYNVSGLDKPVKNQRTERGLARAIARAIA